MAVNDTTCSNDPAFKHLICNNIDIAEGIVLESHIFLISQLPCCAQLALPFWAKITGWIINNKAEEMLLTIVATIFDNDGLALTDYTDLMALDGGQKGEFEVKLVEYHDRAKTYALTIKETAQF
jgi:hypothetical protein